MKNDLSLSPSFSIVVASWSGEAALIRCLDSICSETKDAEIIAAFRGVTDLEGSLGPRYPQVRFVRGAADASVFVLRTLGVQQAQGRLIALLEDHSTVEPGWAAALRKAHSDGETIFGGPIDNDEPASAYEWALYFVEYGIYMPPIPAGAAPILSGVNIAYDRAALLACRETWNDVFYETDVNGFLMRNGHRLHALPNAKVRSRLRMTFIEAMGHLYTGGIHFGDFRRLQSSPLVRKLWIIAAPLVPAVLLARIIRLTFARRASRCWPLLRGMPFLLALLGAWSAGEAASYARGAQAKGNS